MSKYILLALVYPELERDIADIFGADPKMFEVLREKVSNLKLLKMGLNLLGVQAKLSYLEQFFTDDNVRLDLLRDFFREYPEVAFKHKNLLLELARREKYSDLEALKAILKENFSILKESTCPLYYILFVPKENIGAALDLLLTRANIIEVLDAITERIFENPEIGVLLLTIAPKEIREMAYKLMKKSDLKFLDLLVRDSDPNINELLEAVDPRFLALMKVKRGFTWIALSRIIDYLKDYELLDLVNRYSNNQVKLSGTEKFALVKEVYKRGIGKKQPDFLDNLVKKVLSENFELVKELTEFINVEKLLLIAYKLSKLDQATKMLNAYKQTLFMNINPKIIFKCTRDKHRDLALKYPQRFLELWKRANYSGLEPEIAFTVSMGDSDAFIKAIELFGIENGLKYIPNLDKNAKKRVLLYLSQKENFELIDSVVSPEEIFSETEIIKNLIKTNFEYLLKHAKDIPWNALNIIGDTLGKSASALIEKMIQEKNDPITPLDLNLPPEVVLRATQNWHDEIAQKYPKKLLMLWKLAGYTGLEPKIAFTVSIGDSDAFIKAIELYGVQESLEYIKKMKQDIREKILLYLSRNANFEIVESAVPLKEIFGNIHIVRNLIQSNFDYLISRARFIPWETINKISNELNESAIPLLEAMISGKNDFIKPLNLSIAPELILKATRKWHGEIAQEAPEALLKLWRNANRELLDLNLALELAIKHGTIEDLIHLTDRDINAILEHLNEIRDQRREQLLIYLASKIDVLKLPIDPSELLSIPELANRVNDQQFIVDNFIKAPENVQKMLLEKLDSNHKIKLALKLPPDILTGIINAFDDSEIETLVKELMEKDDYRKAIDVIYETKALFAIPKKLWARIWKNYPHLAFYGSKYPEIRIKGALALNIKNDLIFGEVKALARRSPATISDIIFELYKREYLDPISALKRGHFFTASALLHILKNADKETIKWLMKKTESFPVDLKLLKDSPSSNVLKFMLKSYLKYYSRSAFIKDEKLENLNQELIALLEKPTNESYIHLDRILRNIYLKTLKGHTKPVRSVAWSPDGKYIASGSDDNTVRIWDASSGKLLRTLEGHTFFVSSVFSVAWSPDSKYIASGSLDLSVRIWDASSGKLLKTLKGHGDPVNSVAWSPDGKYIASGSADDGIVGIWNARSGKLLRTLREAYVLSVAWSPDGRYIASGSADRTVGIWDACSGKLLRTLKDKNWVWSVAWSPDGKYIASGSWDKTVKIWDASSGKLLRTLRGHTGSVRSVAWSPDGRYIASGSADKTVRIWDALTTHL